MVRTVKLFSECLVSYGERPFGFLLNPAEIILSLAFQFFTGKVGFMTTSAMSASAGSRFFFSTFKLTPELSTALTLLKFSPKRRISSDDLHRGSTSGAVGEKRRRQRCGARTVHRIGGPPAIYQQIHLHQRQTMLFDYI